MSQRFLAVQKGYLALGLLLALATPACNQNDAQAAASAPAPDKKVEQAAAQLPALDQPVVLAKSSYDEEAFALALTGPTSVKVGESVKVIVTLSAKNGFKVNEEYPVKFRPVAGAGLSFVKDTVGKDDG